MCLPLEVFEAARAVFTPSKPVRVRVSATDWAEGGLDVEQTIAFAQAQRAGLRFIDVSSAGLTPGQNIPIGPSYQVPFAEAIKRATRMPTIAWALITEPKQAEAVVATGQADMASRAHPLRPAVAVARPRRTRHRGPKAEAADPLAAEAATQHCPESDGCGRGRPIQRGLVIAGWVMVRGHAESSRKKRA